MLNNSVTNTNLQLRSVDLSDIKDLFKWRNHPEVRKNSFNTNIISWTEHAMWFKAKIKEPETIIYIAFSGEDKIGSIRFEYKADAIQVSIMLNPDFIGKSFGSEVIRLAVRKFINNKKGANKPLIAEIKKSNTASVKAFEKAGFEENHITFVYNT